jgi:hypothetical protein
VPHRLLATPANELERAIEHDDTRNVCVAPVAGHVQRGDRAIGKADAQALEAGPAPEQ